MDSQLNFTAQVLGENIVEALKGSGSHLQPKKMTLNKYTGKKK